MLIDGGLIELRVESKQGDRVRARVVNGGPVKTRKGINLPDTDLPFEISEKDRSDIAFAVAEEADYLAASYVGEGSHVEAIREVVSEAGGRIPIIAKIERKTAIEKLDEITVAADGLMVARGDLGVEVPLYTVPVLQKKIVAAGRLSGKPVIVATQMLESMIEQPRPTRAEATDVANAVFDGADALMLSGETAAGKYPVAGGRDHGADHPGGRELRPREQRAAQAPAAGARPRPAHLRARPRRSPVAGAEPSLDVTDIISAAAVYAAGQIGVRRIVAFSQSGFTARLVARYRPPSPIMAFTPDARVARQIQLDLGRAPLRRRVPGRQPGRHRQGGRARASRGEAGRSRATGSSSSWGTPCASAPWPICCGSTASGPQEPREPLIPIRDDTRRTGTPVVNVLLIAVNALSSSSSCRWGPGSTPS